MLPYCQNKRWSGIIKFASGAARGKTGTTRGLHTAFKSNDTYTRVGFANVRGTTSTRGCVLGPHEGSLGRSFSYLSGENTQHREAVSCILPRSRLKTEHNDVSTKFDTVERLSVKVVGTLFPGTT